jgi:hypothetical protein
VNALSFSCRAIIAASSVKIFERVFWSLAPGHSPVVKASSLPGQSVAGIKAR